MRSQNEGGEVEANAYDMLQWLAQQTDTPDSVQAAAMRLTTRVSYDHTLPFPEDPIEDALMIVESVLGENWNEQGDDRLSGS
jgi:hypothetical protein